MLCCDEKLKGIVMSAESITLIALVILAGIGFISAMISTFLEGHKLFTREWWSSWLQGISTEMAGAIVTAILLGLVVGVVQEREAENVLQGQLVREMGGPDNAFARRAARELRAREWLTDGTLKDANMEGANLEDASLFSANLIGVNFTGADLEGANFTNADLSRADLRSANLSEASLKFTNLQNAALRRTNLQKAELFGCDLTGANLVAADLTDAIFNGSTILPDGSNWSAEVDMGRFTNSTHPEFWRSADDASPAYEEPASG
jgi:hypothetical protein